MWRCPMWWLKGFTWLLDPGSRLYELGLCSSAALVQYLASVANTPSEWTGLHVFPWRIGMPVPEGWPVEPFLCPPLPRNVRLMLLPCVVSNRRRPLLTDLPCFLLGPGVAIAQSPCWLGWEGRTWGVWRKTIATLIVSSVQGTVSWFLLHLLVGKVTARSWSFRHNSIDDRTSRPLDVCPGPRLPLLPWLPPRCSPLFGRPCRWLPSFSPSRSGVSQRRPIAPWLGLARQTGLMSSLDSVLTDLWRL